MAFLPCDICGKITDMRGSWDTPIKIICSECAENRRILHEKSNEEDPYFEFELDD